MGAIQEPTAAMGPYRTEIRRESVYLSAKVPTAQAEFQCVDGHTVHVPVSHAASLLAALDQVVAHKGWKDWAARGETERARFEATTSAGQLVLTTPFPVYIERRNDDTVFDIEIAYEDVPALRSSLAAL